MLSTETDWRKARRNNRIGIALGAVALLLGPWASQKFGIDRHMLIGAASGIFGVSLALEIWGYRKPKKPSPGLVEKLDRQNIPVMLISTLATWGFLGCFLAAVYLGEDSAAFWPLIGIGSFLILSAVALLPKLLNHMRYARVAPELHDERSQNNWNKACQKSFLITFQVSFLGGLVLMCDIVTLPPEFVALGIGMISMMTASLLWCWYDWKDGK